jgi:hypothetical protein
MYGGAKVGYFGCARMTRRVTTRSHFPFQTVRCPLGDCNYAVIATGRTGRGPPFDGIESQLLRHLNDIHGDLLILAEEQAAERVRHLEDERTEEAARLQFRHDARLEKANANAATILADTMAELNLAREQSEGQAHRLHVMEEGASINAATTATIEIQLAATMEQLNLTREQSDAQTQRLHSLEQTLANTKAKLLNYVKMPTPAIRLNIVRQVAKAAAEGIDKALAREKEKGRSTFDARQLSEYSDRDFVANLKEHEENYDAVVAGAEDSAEIVITFLDAVIREVERLGRDRKMATSGLSLINQSPDEQFETRFDLVALIVASIMSADDPLYRWPKMTGISLILQSLTNSKMVLDIVHRLIPASHSYQALYNAIKRAALSAKDARGGQIFRRDVVAYFDNLGEYRVKTSRAGQLAAERRIVPIITMIELFYLRGDEFLQGLYTHSPGAFRPLSEVRGNFPLFYNLQSEIMPGVETAKDGLGDNMVSEEATLQLIVLVVSQHYMQQYSSGLVEGADPIVEGAAARKEAKHKAAVAPPPRIVCQHCDKEYDQSKGMKRVCTEGCGQILQDTAPVFGPFVDCKFVAPKKRAVKTGEDTFMTVYEVDGRGQIVRHKMTMAMPAGDEEEEEFVGVLSSGLNLVTPGGREHIGNIVRELLLPEWYNPNTPVAFRRILNRIGRERGIPGPWLEEQGVEGEEGYLPKIEAQGCQWCYVGFNQGADPTSVAQLLGPAYSARFHPILEAGTVSTYALPPSCPALFLPCPVLLYHALLFPALLCCLICCAILCPGLLCFAMICPLLCPVQFCAPALFFTVLPCPYRCRCPCPYLLCPALVMYSYAHTHGT